MDGNEILHISQLCNNIFETETYDKDFLDALVKYADLLLSSSSSDPNQIQPDENYQALIMLMSKLVVVSFKILPDFVFHQLFRSIVAFNLHFFSISKQDYTQFINEWPIPFSRNYLVSILSNFLPSIDKKPIIAEFSLATLFLYIYFSNEPIHNPFLIAINQISSDLFPLVFDSIQLSLSTSLFSVILFYTLVTQSPTFKAYCLSCVDVSWSFSLVSALNNILDKNEQIEIRLNILLIFTEDTEFSLALSKDPNVISLKIIRELLSLIREKITNNSKSSPNIIMTCLSIMLNIGQKISSFDGQTADSVFSLLKFLIKHKEANSEYLEYIKLLVMFIEAICVHRTRYNVELIYSVLRQFEVLDKITEMCNASQKSVDFYRCLQNLQKMKDFMVENIIEKNKNITDYQNMLILLTSCIEAWNTEEFFQVVPYPSYTYLLNDFQKSLNFFRVMILKEIQSML